MGVIDVQEKFEPMEKNLKKKNFKKHEGPLGKNLKLFTL